MANHRPQTSFSPRLLRRERAAIYLDISASTFDKLVKDGLLPAPKRLHSMKLWDRQDLDHAADHLPHDDGPRASASSDWD